MSDMKLFNIDEKPTWCPGCGDFAILASIKQAFAGLDLYPHEMLLVSGIGCGSKLPYYMKANGFDALHGRALPVATGAKLGNHELKVVVISGDGDGYGIGGNHFMHTMRRNPDLTHVVENNQVYGLTKGQYSPTSEKGYVSTTSPDGAIEVEINPTVLALAGGASLPFLWSMLHDYQRQRVLTLLDPSQEGRLKSSHVGDGLKADHPFFWSGYLLVDTGVSPER